MAVAEKLSALKTEEYFAGRAAKGDVSRALRILERAGVGNPPAPGDELRDRPIQLAGSSARQRAAMVIWSA